MARGDSREEAEAQAARVAMERRDWRGALALFGARATLSLQDLLDKALAQRMLGDLEAAIATLNAVLAIEPRHFLALLSQGALHERLGRRNTAARVYKRALAAEPIGEALPEGLAAATARARQAVAAYTQALEAHLRAQVGTPDPSMRAADRDRFEEGLAIYAGAARPFVQNPLLLHYPRLPAIPFYDRDLFPWLETLEAATPVIQAELAIALEARAGAFTPYIAYPAGAPVDQWADLNHSPRWKSFFLWKDGARQDGACETCPRTAALLERLPLLDQAGFGPTAIFSVLDARTHIPPHTGSANTRLLVHLPLVLPGPARFRVGNVTRPWKMGEAWVFDDTIEHEAWNDADTPRVIMILDVWNPFLSLEERAMITAMMQAKNAFQAID